MSRKNELEYKYALDISRVFSSEEHISSFLKFFMEEVNSFADEIDKNGNQIPYPIIYSDKGFVYQTDYNFYVHCLAKYMAMANENFDVYLSILNIYGIRTGSQIKNGFKDKRRQFLMFLSENVNLIFSANNLNNKLMYMQNSTPILYEFRGRYFQYKTISMPGTFNDNSEKLYGMPLFIGKENWHSQKERFKQNFDENNMTQVAFQQKNIDSFLDKNNEKKYNYFTINTVKIKENNRYINYNNMSKISFLDLEIQEAIEAIKKQKIKNNDNEE